MKTSSKFGVYSEEPKGTTFEPGTFPKVAGDSNTKRKARFGVMNDEPKNVTFNDPENKPSPPFPIPSADVAPMKSKTINETGGQGMYDPMTASGRVAAGSSYAGRPGIGKSSPKRGQKMPTTQGFRK